MGKLNTLQARHEGYVAGLHGAPSTPPMTSEDVRRAYEAGYDLGRERRTPPTSQSDEALINVGPINRIPGTDSISCPGLPSGMMCLGWGEQGWAITDKDGKRITAGNWGECATLPASQSEALVEAIADYNDILRSCAAVAQRQGQNTSWDALGRRIKTILKKHHSTWLEYCGHDAGTD